MAHQKQRSHFSHLQWLFMVIPPKVKPQRLKPEAGPDIIPMKGGEKNEENQAHDQKDSDGKKGEPSQADEKVNRLDQNGWYPENFKGHPKEFLGCHPRKFTRRNIRSVLGWLVAFPKSSHKSIKKDYDFVVA